jgi:hypothetical protein
MGPRNIGDKKFQPKKCTKTVFVLSRRINKTLSKFKLKLAWVKMRIFLFGNQPKNKRFLILSKSSSDTYCPLPDIKNYIKSHPMVQSLLNDTDGVHVLHKILSFFK